MVATVADIIQVMDQLAPPSLAEDWDNVGLQVGDRRWPVRIVGVALDPSPEVVQAGCEMKMDMLVTHHPLIFNSLKSIDFNTTIGSIIDRAARQRMTIFSAHTNLDKTADGLNDILARKIGLKNLQILEPEKEPDQRTGIGRIGTLENPIKLENFALEIKKKIELKNIKFVGKPDLMINKVAVCTGSGSSLLKPFFSSGAQVYISGDLRYHDARDTEAVNLGLVDIGHFSSEYLMVGELVKRLKRIFSQKQIEVEVKPCGIEKDPFIVL
jgi:dinuclear metal center YbgI/SA1388 family protein